VTVYLVDTIEVAADRLEAYLELVETVGVPVMTEAGARLDRCTATSVALGEPVEIQIVWSFDDHGQWNEIRKNMVLDPRWYEYGRRGASLRTGGTRRFHYPTPAAGGR